MPAEPNKKLEKKRKIIDSAYQIFKSKNIYNTAIDDIVKSAGIARGTFYLYFKDKSDLIEQLVFLKSAENMKELLKKAEADISVSDNVYEICRKFIDLYIDFLIEQKETLAILTKNISSCLRDFPEFYDEDTGRLFKSISDRFSAFGISEEEVHKRIYISVDMIGSVCADAILLGKPFGIESIRYSLADAALAVIFGGTHSGKGENDEK